MTQEEMTLCLERYGALDLASIKANIMGERRMEEFSSGPGLLKTPWHSNDEYKYDLAMSHYGMLSGTYLYLQQTQPEMAKLTPPNPQEVPTAGDLYKWIVDNVWDGQRRMYEWQIKQGQRQVANGRVPMTADLGQQERYRKRILAMRDNPAPPAPPAPPPTPFQQPPYNVAREREREREREGPPAGWMSQQEVETRIRAAQVEERQRIQAEIAAAEERRRIEQKAEDERRRAEEERNRLMQTLANVQRELDDIRSGRVPNPSQQVAASPHDQKMAALQAQMESLQKEISAHLATRSTQLAAPPAPSYQTPPEPPADLPEPPEGYYLAWDFAKRRYYYAPKAVPQTVGTAPVVTPPAAPPPAAPPPADMGILGTIQKVVNVAKETQEAGRLLVGVIPGVRLDDELGPPPAKNNLSDETAPPPAPKEEEKPKKVFHEEGGLMLRLDKDGNVQDLNGLDVLANLGKLAEQGQVLSGLWKDEQKKTAEVEAHKAKLQIEIDVERAKAEKAKAEAEKAKAEAEKAKAEAVTAQRTALNLLGVGDDQEEGVSSGE